MIFGRPLSPRRTPALPVDGVSLPWRTPGIGEGVLGNPDPNAEVMAQVTRRTPGVPSMAFAGIQAPARSEAPALSDAMAANASALPAIGPMDTSASDAVLSGQMANARTRAPGFFQNNGLGGRLLRGLGEFATQYSAGAGNPAALMTLRNRYEQSRLQQERQWEREAEAEKQRRPEYFMSGRDRIKYDPVTGQSSTVYDGPEDFETYADQFGDPGTEGYRTAAQDYVLRSSGPTAYGFDVGLEGARQDNREELEGVRQRNRRELRSTPTYAQANPRPAAPPRPRAPSMSGTMGSILAKVASGQPLSAGEREAWGMYRARPSGGKGGGGSAAVPTISSPAEARKLPPGTKFRTPDGRMMTR